MAFVLKLSCGLLPPYTLPYRAAEGKAFYQKVKLLGQFLSGSPVVSREEAQETLLMSEFT